MLASVNGKKLMFGTSCRCERVKKQNTIEYLRVKISNKRNCFADYKNEYLIRAKMLANMVYSVIATVCDRVLIGKTYCDVLIPLFFGNN